VSEAEDRRRARAGWEVRKFGPGATEEAADYDAQFWARIPLDERALAVWQQSLEVYSLSDPGARESRHPRSALRLQRR
jgi:hypothetical protein